MKKLAILVMSLFMVLAFWQNSQARTPYRSYQVSEFREEGIVVKDETGKLFIIKKDADDLKVGDIVRYDKVRDRMIKSPWQVAKIVEISNSTATIELKNGQNREVRMRSRYRGKFSQGEDVIFNESADQLEKTDFHLPEEE